MLTMITPRIKPSAFFRREPKTDLFVQDHREAKLGGFVANLAAIDAGGIRRGGGQGGRRLPAA